jgi:hypothetical protein
LLTLPPTSSQDRGKKCIFLYDPVIQIPREEGLVVRGVDMEFVEVSPGIGFPCRFKALVSIETLGVLEELVRELIIHPSQLAPQEIIGPGHRLILTIFLILFSAAARARIISSRFAHRGLLGTPPDPPCLLGSPPFTRKLGPTLTSMSHLFAVLRRCQQIPAEVGSGGA